MIHQKSIPRKHRSPFLSNGWIWVAVRDYVLAPVFSFAVNVRSSEQSLTVSSQPTTRLSWENAGIGFSTMSKQRTSRNKCFIQFCSLSNLFGCRPPASNTKSHPIVTDRSAMYITTDYCKGSSFLIAFPSFSTAFPVSSRNFFT